MTSNRDLDNVFSGLSTATARKFTEEEQFAQTSLASFLDETTSLRQCWEQEQAAIRERANARRAKELAEREAQKPATLLDVWTRFRTIPDAPPFEYLFEDDNKKLSVRAGNGKIITIKQKADPDKYNSFKFDVTENCQTYDSTAADVAIDLALFVIRNKAPARTQAQRAQGRNLKQ